VPSLPPGRYEHVGILQQIGQAVSGLDDLVDMVMDKLGDHFPHNYIASLRDWLD